MLVFHKTDPNKPVVYAPGSDFPKCKLSVPLTVSLQLLGVELSSNLNFVVYIEAKVQIAAKNLGIVCKLRRYFTPEQLLQLYQAPVVYALLPLLGWFSQIPTGSFDIT